MLVQSHNFYSLKPSKLPFLYVLQDILLFVQVSTYLIPDGQVAEFRLAAPLEAQLEGVHDVDVEEVGAVVDGVVEAHYRLLGVVEGLEAVRTLQVGTHHAAVADPVRGRLHVWIS